MLTLVTQVCNNTSNTLHRYVITNVPNPTGKLCQGSAASAKSNVFLNVLAAMAKSR